MKRMIRAGLWALGALSATGLAAFEADQVEQNRSDERAVADVQAGVLRANDALKAALERTEARVRNGLETPRLVAALDARVDTETLRDLLLNETWWGPFRASVKGFAIVRRGTSAEVSSNLPSTLDLRPLVERARAGNHPASRLVSADGQLLAIAASTISLRGQKVSPVLLAAEVIDEDAMTVIADRARAATGIFDGRRLLLGRGAAGSSVADLSTLGATPAARVPGARGLDRVGQVAAVSLEGGLRLLVVARRPMGTKLGERLSWSVLAILIAGLGTTLSVLILLLRRPRALVVPRDQDIPAPPSVSKIGRYNLIDRIGQGGMADIFSAVTTGEGGFRRNVVIKRLRPELATDERAVAHFCDEANLLGALHHPNIVAVHDFGRDGQNFFLAEEYVLGRTLGQIVRCLGEQKRVLSRAAVSYVSCELLKALDYAHGRCNDDDGRPLGIVHRDVSPENIMIASQGGVKLVDFGIVQATERRVNTTDRGIIKGSVTFMSPEQARGLAIDARADLYAVGMVIFFGLTGGPLYESESTYDLLTKAAAGPGPLEWAAIEGLPPAFIAILRRALAPRIGDRYQTARQMLGDLAPLTGDGAQRIVEVVAENFGRDLEIEARRLHTAFPQTPVRARKPRRRSSGRGSTV